MPEMPEEPLTIRREWHVMNERDRHLIEEGKRQIIESLYAPPDPWWLKALFLPGAMILLFYMRIRDLVRFIGDRAELFFTRNRPRLVLLKLKQFLMLALMTMMLLVVTAAMAALALAVLSPLWTLIKMVSQ